MCTKDLIRCYIIHFCYDAMLVLFLWFVYRGSRCMIRMQNMVLVLFLFNNVRNIAGACMRTFARKVPQNRSQTWKENAFQKLLLLEKQLVGGSHIFKQETSPSFSKLKFLFALYTFGSLILQLFYKILNIYFRNKYFQLILTMEKSRQTI